MWVQFQAILVIWAPLIEDLDLKALALRAVPDLLVPKARHCFVCLSNLWPTNLILLEERYLPFAVERSVGRQSEPLDPVHL